MRRGTAAVAVVLVVVQVVDLEAGRSTAASRAIDLIGDLVAAASAGGRGRHPAGGPD